jgi:hypothetical protein
LDGLGSLGAAALAGGAGSFADVPAEPLHAASASKDVKRKKDNCMMTSKLRARAEHVWRHRSDLPIFGISRTHAHRRERVITRCACPIVHRREAPRRLA